MNRTGLKNFGTRYAAAWSSQNPVSLASFYNESGSLTVNGGAPSVGRAALAGPFESTGTRSGRLAPMASLRSRKVTTMKRSINAS